jgi:hypothetical protein
VNSRIITYPLLLAVAFAVLVVLNPSKEQHREALIAAIIKAHPQDYKEYLLNPAVHNYVYDRDYNSYIIYSTTGWYSNPDTVGFCGNVILWVEFKV